MIPLLLVVLAGCPKTASPSLDYAAPPRLPSPQAATYERVPVTPPDPVLAHLVGTARWDAHLSGGATPLALQGARGPWTLSPWEVRETAWRAGYPYPVEEMVGFHAEVEAPPPAEVAAWLGQLPPGSDVGLVRARSPLREAWVGLAARPRVDLGPVPRAMAEGSVLQLPHLADARFRIADADGGLIEGPLDFGKTLELRGTGEWLVQVLDDSGIVAWFPLYVGVQPPLENLLPAVPAEAGDASAIAELTSSYLAEIRDTYGLDAWVRDPILDAAASRLESDPESTLVGVLERLGLGEPRASWACEAKTTEACIDAWVWEPGRRAVLLSPELTHVGIATSTEAAKVRIRVVLTGD